MRADPPVTAPPRARQRPIRFARTKLVKIRNTEVSNTSAEAAEVDFRQRLQFILASHRHSVAVAEKLCPGQGTATRSREK